MRGPLKFLLASTLSLLVGSAQALTINSQPKASTINAGSTATFKVATTNGTVSGYQWFLGATALQDGTNASGAIITGSQSSTLTIENVGTNLNAGLFKVVLTGGAAPLSSVAAKLTVLQGTLVNFNTAFGSMVVELFDHDKPIAVQNFLHYVTLGLYTNAFFTRLEPNFVLQGGGYAATDTGDTAFTTTTNIQYNAYYCVGGFVGMIANEANRAPRVRNTAGTLALAQAAGNPDSADNQFYFNLGDNSTGAAHDLDSGSGYTVFGRVISGMNVLTAFNNLSSDNIVSNQVTATFCGGSFLPAFPTLPVKTTDANNIRNSDLYFTGISLLTHPVTDKIPPTARITYPAANSRVHFGPLTITGTASDNVGVARVECYMYRHSTLGDNNAGQIIDSEFPVPVLGTTNWSITMDPAVGFGTPPQFYTPGPWTIILIIHDGHGNVTQTLQSFVATTPIAMGVSGLGSIVPNLNGQYLEVGKTYRVSAVPGKGQLFGYWTGLRKSVRGDGGTPEWVPTVSYSQALTFTNMTNLTVTANFVSNYFPVVQGTYYGLAAPTDHNNITVSNAGLCKITSTSIGTFSGTLALQNKVLPFSGKWDYTGNVSNVKVVRAGTTPLTMNLSIDLSNNTGRVTGTVASADWTSDIDAYLAVKQLSTNTVPAKGAYVMTFPSQSANSALGDSFATVNVSPLGTMTVTGLMADNTPWTETVGVGKAGNWPLFASLYTGRGLVIGLEDFDGTSVARWIRPAISNAFFASEFNTGAYTNGLFRYVKPTANSTYTLHLGGNTLTQVDYGLTFNSVGRFVASGSGNLPALTLTATTGLLSGTWKDSSNGLWTLKGVFISPESGGRGFILGPHGQTGYLRIDPL